MFSIVQFCYSLLPRKMQKALKNTMNRKETKSQYKIEFLNGDPHKITNYEILSNNIVLINAKNLIISIIRALFPIENLILALILIILFAVPLDEYDDSSYFILQFTLASLIFEMVIQLISFIAIYYQRSQYIKKINEKQCCVLSQLKDLSGTTQAVSAYQIIKWRDLNLGEIVCLQYDDISPADLLILDSSLELIQIGYQYRSACNSTFIPINSASKGVMIDFKINLSGKLSFTEEIEGIKGNLKLKNDPKSATFSKRNLILRGERLDSANWLFGIVIRVGEQCQSKNTEISNNIIIKSNGIYQQYRTKVFLIAFSFVIVFLITKLIVDSVNFSDYFYNDLAFVLVIFPQNLLWLNQLQAFVQIMKENNLFKWKLNKKIANSMDHIFQRKSFSNIRILQEDENKILVPIPNHNNYCNLYNSPINIGRNNPKFIKLKGYQSLNQMNIIDLVNTQIVVFENFRENCFAKATIQTIRNQQNTFVFNYSKIQDLMSKSTTTTKHNFDKILIETNRCQMYDEQKTTDFDLLIAEKNLVPLKQSHQLAEKDEQPIKSFQKPGFFREKTKLKQEGNSNPYLSFRKNSFRNQRNINLLHSPQQSSSKQQFQFNRTAYFNKSFQKSMEKSMSTDHLIGDQLTELDFFEHLFTSEENTGHEMLIVSLLCNTISSYYNSNTKQLQLQFSNTSDKTFIEFAELFDYLFLCSTVVDNFKQEYQLPQIIKKVISIQGEVKIFEILFLQEPTEQRKDTLSILVRDPESFLLDEGCLLYTRIKTNKLKDNEKYKELNEQLEEMIWDGESPYIYFKQELNATRTEELLKQIDQISQTYGDRQQELDKVFSKLEEQSTYLFTLGLKKEQRQIKPTSQHDLSQQIIESEKIYLNLLTYGMKICFLTQDSYEDLILFLRNHYIIQSKDQIIHFYEKEVSQLQNKVRLQLEFLIEEQLVLEPEPKSHLSKFIILNEEALQTILQDEYLKHHFSFIIQFSLGLAGYQLNNQMRVKFLKQLRSTFTYITTLGNSNHDQNIFNKSDCSFCIYQNDPLIVLNNPDFMITKINQLLYMLFIQAPQEVLRFFKIFEIQLYRTIILGISTYVASYLNYYEQTSYQLLIYLVPSNILMMIFTYQTQHNYEKQITLHQFSLFARRFESSRAYSQINHILKIIFLSCLESIAIVCVVLNLNQLTIQGKESPESILLITYINCELLEKLKLLFQIIDDENLSKLDKIKQIILLIIILILSISIFQIAAADSFSQVYNLEIFIAGLFNSILVISISLEIQQILDQFNFSFTSLNIVYQIEKLEIQLNKFNQLLNYQHLSYLTTNTVSILNKLFQNKEIIDDCILKYLKGDNFSTTDQLDKYLQFIDKRTEGDFRNYIKYNPEGKVGFIITFVGYEMVLVLVNIYYLATDLVNQTNILTNLILSIIQFIIQLLLLFIIYSVIKNKSIQLKIKIASNFVRFAFKIIFVIGENGILNVVSSLLFIVSYSLNFQSAIGIKIFVISLIIPLVFDITILIQVLHEDEIINGSITSLLILTLALFAILQLVYKTEYIIRYQYILHNKLSNEYKKLNDVLGLLVPKFIKERITKGQIQISEEQGEVTILFCDICDFDNIIRSESVNIVEFLDNLYRSFDQICQTYDIQKIETVGKTYMAAAGLKDYDLGLNSNSPKSTVKILQAAIKMMESAKTQKFGQNQELILKIGIHYGKVIAGVIGAHKPQFSLIGDTVNTTSRVCSTGISGFITLSEQAYNNIGKHLNYTFIHKQVTAKGKGLINTYQLIQQVRELKPQQSILMSRRTLIVHQNSPRLSKKQKTVVPSKFSSNNQNEEIEQKILLKKKSSQLSDTLKSPKLVIRQRQKDLQMTPKLIKRQTENAADLYRSGNIVDYNRQSSQNQIPDIRGRNTTFQKSGVNIIKAELLTVNQNNINENQTIFKEEINKQFQDIKVVEDEQPIKIEKIGETDQIKESHDLDEIKHQKRKSINYCKEQIKQTFNKESNQNIMKQELKTSQDNIFLANQAYAKHQAAERRRSTVRKTLIIIEQPKLLKQVSKQFDRIPDDGPQTQYDVKKIRRLKSNKQDHEGTLSAVFRSPKEQKLEDQDEIEIPKVPFIIQKQSELNADYVEQLLKFKVDQYSTLQNQSSSQYHNDDQSKYNQIYELYKDCEISQTKRTSKFLTIILIIVDLLYFNFEEQMDQLLNCIIAIICHCLVLIAIVIIIHKLNEIEENFKYIKGLIILYLIYNIAFLHLINVFINSPEYEIILTVSLMATIYINIFNLDIFTLQDRKYLAIIYLVGSELLTIFKFHQFQITFFTLSIFLMTYYAQYFEKKILANNYQLSQQLVQQQEKQKSVLSYLLPAHILARFLQVESNTNDNFTDVFEHATILFADIAGFTKYSSSVEAEQVVNMLRILFQQFDEFCQKMNVYKLFTIGDCYVCMGIVDANNRSPVEEAINVILFGLKMIEIINQINKDPQFSHLNMRIGAHTGKIIGGVVGTDVVRYDIYGEDVTIANKMESNGSEGQMMVSEATKDLIESEEEDLFQFTFAKDVYINSQDQLISAFFVQIAQQISFD